MIKNSLTLINDKPNLFDFSQSVIDSFSLGDDDKELYMSTVKIFMNRMKSHFTYKYAEYHINNNFEKIDIIKLTKYPLPVTYNVRTGHIIINIAALQKRSLSNIEPRDLYTMLVYGHVCASLSKNKQVIDTKYADVFCEYMSFVFLKLFAKKYGITGSYVDKIPQFKFLVYTYVYSSFFGLDSKSAIKYGAILSKYDYARLMNIDPNIYDLTKFSNLLKILSDSDVTPGLNEYKFLEQIIRSFGTMNLVFFEDLMRFSSILISASVNANSYFSASFQMFNTGYYKKCVEIIDNTVKKNM